MSIENVALSDVYILLFKIY